MTFSKWYKNAKSKVSLFSGTISGILLLIAGIASFLEQSWGLLLGSAIAAILVIVFIARLWKTQKFMPAGIMIIGGVVVVLLTVGQVVS